MTAPHDPHFDKDTRPGAVPDNRVLHPLFGDYCSTETFEEKNMRIGKKHVHYEAHLEDPVKKTWAVSKVVTVSDKNDKATSHVHLIKNKVNFKEAVEILGNFEKDCLKNAAAYDSTYPDAPVMGFIHFKAFAEREGYIFDISGKPHARPNPHALPLGCSFYQEDVDRSNEHMERPADEFDNNGPASKLPNTHFLLDHFTSAAHNNSHGDALNGLRALNLMDRFVGLIGEAHENLVEYCDKYAELGYGGLIDDALARLEIADSTLKQLKAYGADTANFEDFVLQCRTTCFVLHAEGLYDLMNKGLGDFDANEMAFRQRTAQAVESYRKIDASEEGHKTLENMIVQTPEPRVPDAIGHFVTRYREERKKFGGDTPKPAAGAPKGKPPAP